MELTRFKYHIDLDFYSFSLEFIDPSEEVVAAEIKQLISSVLSEQSINVSPEVIIRPRLEDHSFRGKRYRVVVTAGKVLTVGLSGKNLRIISDMSSDEDANRDLVRAILAKILDSSILRSKEYSSLIVGEIGYIDSLENEVVDKARALYLGQAAVDRGGVAFKVKLTDKVEVAKRSLLNVVTLENVENSATNKDALRVVSHYYYSISRNKKALDSTKIIETVQAINQKDSVMQVMSELNT